MRLHLTIATIALLLAPAAGAQTTPAERALNAHVAFLADDAMKGREAGTPEYDRAADYVAREMAAAGLKPAGERGTFLQNVRLVAATPLAGGSMTIERGRRRTQLAFNKDWTVRAEPRAAAVDVSAPVVFAGYGMVDPLSGRDDYAGLDVRGKIVAVLYGAPSGLSSEPRAHFGSRTVKAEAAAAKGAAGIVFIEATAIHQTYPFARMAKRWDAPGLNWVGPDGAPKRAGAPQLGVVSYAGAEKLFAGTPMKWRDILAADAAGGKMPTGPLGITLTSRLRYRLDTVDSPNVIGLLEGSDPKLKAENVVLSAHLDHIGVGEPIGGDAINNGALDNAMGIAAMLEVARTFRASPVRPRRSILFVAVTAEEQGLIGSDYFATHPTVARDSIVANVNLDMPILTYRFVDLVALGAERSSIGPIVARAAAAEGLKLVPDPAPEEGNFVRTDHYSFVQAGIPAVSLDLGPGGPGAAATQAFLEHHYHQPSDDLNLPIDWTAAATFVRVNFAIARGIADADRRPAWNKGDFFGTLYAAPTGK